jgi:hypothetical protein
MSANLQEFVLAECSHCSFRFGDPDDPLQEDDELICPQCHGIFYVLSLDPPEFHCVRTYDVPGPLFTHSLVAKGMWGDSPWIEDVAGVVERARKQGLKGITVRVSFEDLGVDRLNIEVVSLE